MRRRHLVSGIATLAGLPPLARPTLAQSQWPTRPITLIVPFPPGGQADIAARGISASLEQTLGRPVVIDNRGGAGGGSVGNAAAARAAPDGYTLLVTLASLAVLPEADRLFERQPSYEVTQLEPIARIIGDPFFLAVAAGSPWRSAHDFIEDARRRPGAISYGSSGSYGVVHVAMEMLTAAAGVQLLHVPFRGGAPAMTALLSGTVAALATSPGIVRQHMEAGRVRALASWGAERLAEHPDVPTLKELGWSDVEFLGWAGLFAPRGVPAPVLSRLREAMRTAMTSPEVLQVFQRAGSLPAYLDTPEFSRFLEADNARLIATVRKIGKVD
ncbi:tripartite tricarboxylate transporter substrate binding protein [Falsiroseomonas oryzae]|uniref:tripartite tricarboxylate transporter substrate binding protein n=1 Tax=Falsiroseomonas oryzae TaxID=2766473 RepID=UPI0022EB14A7|nr:tripartite tricarboxylate transporter substrate binding protein [Roseomonas sp. MO-31]